MKNGSAPFLPHAQISLRSAIWSVVVGVGLVAPMVVFLASLPLPHTAVGDAAQQQRHVDYASYPVSLFLKAVIFFPLVEEVFYRGIILQLLRRFCSNWFSILFSAAFFGVTHLGQGLATGLNAFLLGCFFAWLVIRSRSLYPSILCHATFNFTWLFVTIPLFRLDAKMLPRPGSESLSPAEIFPLWWLFLSIGVLLFGLVWLAKELSKNESAPAFPANTAAPNERR